MTMNDDPKDIPEGGFGLFFHMLPKASDCQHDFQGWREIDGGLGGERVCTKCGMGAMAHSLNSDLLP